MSLKEWVRDEIASETGIIGSAETSDRICVWNRRSPRQRAERGIY